MRLEEIGHNRKVKATRRDMFGNTYEVEGLLVYGDGASGHEWYLLSNSDEWDGDRHYYITDYEYSWVLTAGQYYSVSPLGVMIIRKEIKKHKMIDMT